MSQSNFNITNDLAQEEDEDTQPFVISGQKGRNHNK